MARVRIGNGHGLGRIVGPSAEDDAEDVVVVSFGIFKPLDDKGSNAVCSAVSVRRGIPRLSGVGALGQEVAVA